MSNTDILRKNEKQLLPAGYSSDHVFDIVIGDYRGTAEVDGFNSETRDAIEICFSETEGSSPKPGQKRKLASDVLKLIFLKDLGLINRGRVYLTSVELYTWCQQSGSWLNAARTKYGITVELKSLPKASRKQVKHALSKARMEQH
ncbi:MAG: hypothetical protein WC477_01255 [Patescibacteria group bacterium]